MRGQPTGFWGKLEYDSAGRDSPQPRIVAWHPAAHHCADVAACAEALVRHTLIGSRLARLVGTETNQLDEVTVQRLCVLAAIHDIGKFATAFQVKALPEARRPCRAVGHIETIVETLFGDLSVRKALFEALQLETMAAWAGADGDLEGMLLAVFSHHGRPVQPGKVSAPEWWGPWLGVSPIDAIREFMDEVRRWYPFAWSGEGPLLPSFPEFQHAWAGILMLADWLGSDQELFPFSEDATTDRIGFARARALRAVEETGLAGSGRAGLAPLGDPFARISEHRPWPAQAALRDHPLPSESGSITIIEAETGSGKTEAALTWFLRLYAAGLADGMYLALPTRTAASQIYRRTSRAMERAFDPARPPAVVQAVPGYISADELEGRPLPHFRVLWPDEGDEMHWRAWAAEHPKRYLAAGIAVGTIDQVLLSTLQVSHAHMRQAALSRQLLVVDEVHASDTYMTRLLEAVLERHVRAGGHALLMSATLGHDARSRMLAKGLGQRPEPSELEQAVATPYPLVTFATPCGLDYVHDSGSPIGPPKRVQVELAPEIENAAAVADRALQAAGGGARVLVVRNTVATAVETQMALEAAASRLGLERLLFRCNGVITLHHGRFAKPDRLLLDQTLERELGRTRPTSPGLVVVSTQTCEQSLDIDADLLISDLCPMDVLLQRIGRLHRHVRDSRPPGSEKPRVVVLTIGAESLEYLTARKVDRPAGLGTVYGDLRVLEATLRRLRRSAEIEIPRQNRELVEAAVHPRVLQSIADESVSWKRHAEDQIGGAFADLRIAERALIQPDVPFSGEAVAFPTDGRIATRLGADDYLAPFDPAFLSPFRATIRELRIPGRWAPRRKEAIQPAVQAVTGTATRFQFGPLALSYSRLGLQREQE